MYSKAGGYNPTLGLVSPFLPLALCGVCLFLSIV